MYHDSDAFPVPQQHHLAVGVAGGCGTHEGGSELTCGECQMGHLVLPRNIISFSDDKKPCRPQPFASTGHGKWQMSIRPQ